MSGVVTCAVAWIAARSNEFDRATLLSFLNSTPELALSRQGRGSAFRLKELVSFDCISVIIGKNSVDNEVLLKFSEFLGGSIFRAFDLL